MTNYHSLTEYEFQTLCNQLIAYLDDEHTQEPDWKEVAYLFEFNKYEEIMGGMIQVLTNVKAISSLEFSDSFFSEYEEVDEVDDSQRLRFARERISSHLEGYSNYSFTVHSVEIKNEIGELAVLGFSVSGPGGQYGFDIECIGIFKNNEDLLNFYGKEYISREHEISDERILKLWKKNKGRS